MTCEWRELVQGAAERACRTASGKDDAVLLSISFPIPAPEDPLILLKSAATGDGHAFFWQHPTEEFALVAFGALRTLAAEGEARFERVEDDYERIVARSVVEACGADELVGPVFVGGFAFFADRGEAQEWKPFPPACMLLPRTHVVLRGSSALLTVNRLVRSGESLSAITEEFLHEATRVERALRLCGPSFAGVSEAPNLSLGKVDGPEIVEGRGRRAGSESRVVIPDAAQWRGTVKRTLADIHAGRLDKLVLARQCRVRCDAQVDSHLLLRNLRRAYPTCTSFLFRVPGGVFVGATPERLVALENGALRTAAVAGSTARGGSIAEDHRLGRRLLRNAKERREHGVVVQAIEEALAPFCSRVDVAPEPDLLRLENVQHLITRISGRLLHPCSILRLLERLHPSPAVGGYPQAAALEALREREAIDRGWYAGPIGWMDGGGNGDFAVAVRSALIHGASVTFCAGAGIVAGSDPEAELAEVELKMRPILSALRGAATHSPSQVGQKLAS